jgi:hypothetical protein
MRFSDFREAVGAQARAVLYLESGKWEFKFVPDAPTPSVVLDYDRDVAADPVARVGRTPLVDLKTSLWVYSHRDYRKSGSPEEEYVRAVNVKDLTAGVSDEIQETLTLPFVQHATTADDLAQWHLARRKRQRLTLAVTAWWNVIGLEQADFVAIDGHPILAAHGGVDLLFQVTRRRYAIGDDTNAGRIALDLVQLPVLPTKARLLTPEPGTMLPGSSVLFTWSPGFDVVAYQIDVGSTPGGADYHTSGVTHATGEGVTLPVFATPGVAYVRLWSQFSTLEWVYTDYAYARHYTIAAAGGVVAPVGTLAGAGAVGSSGTGGVVAPVGALAGTGLVGASGTGGVVAPLGALAGTGVLVVEGTGGVVAPIGEIAGGEKFWIGADTDQFWSGEDTDQFWLRARPRDRGAIVAPIGTLGGAGTVIDPMFWDGPDTDLYWSGDDSDPFW